MEKKGAEEENSSTRNKFKLSNKKESFLQLKEIQKIEKQQLVLFMHPYYCPKHTNTIYFLNNSEVNINKIDDPVSLQLTEIKDKSKMILYKAYKNIPLPISEPMTYNNIIRTKIYQYSNIIWKLLDKDEMFELLKSLNKYQKYNHFPITWQLARKDNLYINYSKLKNKFPKDYNFIPDTFILPKDYDKVKLKFCDYQLSKNDLWLIKPKASSKGMGINMLRNYKSIPDKCIITKYISYPHLFIPRKYTMKLYVLVTGYSPLKIYLSNNGMINFACENYDLALNNINNRYIHLTSNSLSENIKKNNISNNNKIFNNFKVSEYDYDNWSLTELFNYFKKVHIDKEAIWEKIKDIIIKTFISITEDGIPVIKSFNLSSGNLFELYGIEILLDNKLNPWLIEVNLNPNLECENDIQYKVKSEIITSTLNIIGVIPFAHDSSLELLDGEYKNVYMSKEEESVIESLCEFERPQGSFERIFPVKKNIDYYMKFFDNPQQENLKLWKIIKENK